MLSESPTVFVSCSHRDERQKDRLATHLSVLRGRLAVWEDRQLNAGDDWYAEIEKAIATANVAVLLISADFLASDFILKEEVPRLLRRREQDGLTIVPVLLKSCAWAKIPWLSMQMRPTDARPLMSLRGNAREEAWSAIVTEILQLAEAPVLQQPDQGPAPSYPDAPSKELAEALDAAYQRHEELVSTGGDATESLETILDLKRRLRIEGQLKPGDFLAEGRYRLLDVLGSGGFSKVFKAYDRQTRGLVAVKVLHAQYAQDKTRRDRFFRGARKMGELQHQAIVRVIDPKGQDEGTHYFVMEYVQGGDLRQAVRTGEVSGVEGLALLDEVAEALDLAHRCGVIHRDVKPANILLTTDGKAKLTDFDLVRALDTTAGTRTGSMLGTVLYMAPEAMMSAELADAAADVYSLAMTAAFVLHGEEIPATYLRDAESFFAGLEVPEGVKEALRRATALEASERFGSVLDFCKALKHAPEPTEIQPVPDPVPPTVHQEAAVVSWPSRSGQDSYGEWASFEVGGVEQRLRWIPPGKFTMGTPESEAGRWGAEGPQHQVTLTQGFWLAKTPCTQALWEAVMVENPSRFRSPHRPVERVSWEDCQRFIERSNTLIPGLEARLPSEAEWEYACRAGTKAATWRGSLEILGQRNAPDLDAIAWYGGNSGVEFDLKDGHDSSDWPEKQHPHTLAGTRDVGQKLANPWGLYDMLGNVFEWCEDGWAEYEEGPEVDPVREGGNRVGRGGSWYSNARIVRAACRIRWAPGSRDGDLGFRLALGPGRGAR